MRIAAAVTSVGLSLALAGCANVVASDTPWFTADAPHGEFRQRDGLWLHDDAECRVDEAAPAETWPACAQWSVVRGGTSFTAQWNEETKGRHRARAFCAWSEEVSPLVFDGDPMLAQIGDAVPMKSGTAELSDRCAETAKSRPPRRTKHQALVQTVPDKVGWLGNYIYFAVVASRRDADGRITAIEGSPVFCGPLPEKGAHTEHPFAGLRMKDDNCLAESEESLRDAARSSLVMLKGQPFGETHWVRDGYH